MDNNNNNKKDYDDFFRSHTHEKNEDDQQRKDEVIEHDANDVRKEEEDTYYYSYGSSRQHAQVSPPTGYVMEQQHPTNQQYYEQRPTHLPYERMESAGNVPPGGNPSFQVSKKKPSGAFGKMFLSFMAGAIVVGLLMYTADVQNWFTSNKAITQQQITAPTTEKGSMASSNNHGAAARPDNISELFKSSSPAVVKIETYAKVNTSSRGGSLLDDPFFRQFFGNNYPGLKEKDSTNSNEGQMQQTGMGTGFFFDETGYILTNQHVVGDANQIKVIVEGYDEPFIATLLGSSYDLDLAVLKVEGKEAFPTLSLGSSDDIQIGDWVIAIGNPYGFDHTLTVGVISAKERPIDISDDVGIRNYKNLLQTDASINPGNSGGPLLNVNGEVIGINTAVSSTAQGIGFAIPTSTILSVLDNLKNNKEVPKAPAPFIGADLSAISDEMAEELQLSSTDGVMVRGVYYNSPAYLGDLKQFDIIIGADSKEIKVSQDLIDYIKTKEVGDTINLKVIRKGTEITLPIDIGDKNVFGLK